MFSRTLVHACAFATALAPSACSSSPAPGPPPTHAMYGPTATTNLTPYPSNRYAKSDASSPTGLRVAVGPDTTADRIASGLQGTVAEIDTLDGFSTIGGVFVNFDAEVDSTTLVLPPDQYTGAGAPMALVDIDPASPESGKARGIVAAYQSTTNDDNATTDEYGVLAEPATPLRPRTRYAFVATDAIKDASGRPIAATADTRALLSGEAEGDYGASVRAALPIVTSATGITADHVVLATVFTTETVHDVLVAVAKDRRAAPAPAFSGQWVLSNEAGTPATDTRARFLGHYASPDYRRKSPAQWDVQNGKPVVQTTPALEVYIAFSDATKAGPRPVAIFQHGLGGNKDQCWGTSDRLKPLNAAVFAIDAPWHGSRAPDPGKSDLFGSVTGFFGIDPASKTFDMAAARDNFRQMAADQLELIRFIESLSTLDLLPVGAPDGKPDLDVSKILYIGHSFGSVMGPTIGALAPEITAAVWNVGGSGMTELIRDSGLFSLLVKSLEPPGTPRADLVRFFSFTQGILDPGDSANYAPYSALSGLPGIDGWKPKDVLVQEVHLDNIVPNTATERLARAAGLEQVQPIIDPIGALQSAPAPVSRNLPNGATAGIFQYETADGQPTDHGSLIFTNDAIGQYDAFFQTSLATGHAQIVSPFH